MGELGRLIQMHVDGRNHGGALRKSALRKRGMMFVEMTLGYT
jgi:hypothetical protein